MIVAIIHVDAAREVADFLERAIPFNAPLQHASSWGQVRDALYAISNDTDAIVTDHKLGAILTATLTSEGNPTHD